MENSDKVFCRELAALLAAYGVRMVFVSPGSRNAPLIVAVARHPQLEYEVVIDERSAAFMALGYAVQRNEPVAIVCTSGTAMLNYAPAVAEAFYRDVPLVVVTADRPAQWIDRLDSQTIHQPGAFGGLVKKSVDIPVENGDPEQIWEANTLMNDALAAAVTGKRGPVHINVQLDVPLTRVGNFNDENPRVIETVVPHSALTTAHARAIGRELAPPRRVLVYAAGLNAGWRLNRAMTRLAAIPNIAVMHEAQANLHGHGIIGAPDAVLGLMTDDEREAMTPDVLITLGGSVVSRFMKTWLRRNPRVSHWHVGLTDAGADTFCRLTRRIEMDAEDFMPQLASAMQPYTVSQSDYGRRWHEYAVRARKLTDEFVDAAPWSDLKAVDILFSDVPKGVNLQLSNGTSIRYAQICDTGRMHRIDCNRGVSGIDGSTSTAIGAALGYSGMTLLLTGDMSAQYDLGALASACIPHSFRMAVLGNGGGNIFRYIPTTSQLPELEECFAADVRLPLPELARGYGFRYFEATDAEGLISVLPAFFEEAGRPAVLNIMTDGNVSADTLRKYFNIPKLTDK